MFKTRLSTFYRSVYIHLKGIRIYNKVFIDYPLTLKKLFEIDQRYIMQMRHLQDYDTY